MKSLSKLFFVFTLVLWGLNTAKAQSSLKNDKASKAAEVKDLVNNKDIVFEATTASSEKGNQPLNYHRYHVAVAKDTLVATLPGPNGDVVKFDCTKFAYNAVKGKNGTWDITIKPETKMGDIKELKLAVAPQGNASLHVVRSHGGPLSLDGYIKQEDY
ncbi:MAG TPA: DUF4251 domain-containing protein [Mucilaginibacter sp.]|jgi:hypothetical protein